jgi:hypothetical protein
MIRILIIVQKNPKGGMRFELKTAKKKRHLMDDDEVRHAECIMTNFHRFMSEGMATALIEQKINNAWRHQTREQAQAKIIKIQNEIYPRIELPKRKKRRP